MAVEASRWCRLRWARRALWLAVLTALTLVALVIGLVLAV